MRAIQKYTARTSGGATADAVSLLRVVVPRAYRRDYYFRVYHAALAATCSVYAFKTKAEAKSKTMALPGTALASKTGIAVPLATAEVTLETIPIVLTMSVGSYQTDGWNESFGFTADAGYNVAEELSSWLSSDSHLTADDMPLEGYAFSVAPPSVYPRKWPAIRASYSSLEPIFSETGRVILRVVVSFTVFVADWTDASYRSVSEALAAIRSALLDEYRVTPPTGTGRIYHDLEYQGQEEPALIEEADTRGFGGATSFVAVVDAAREG
jgi:hypothetical protein